MIQRCNPRRTLAGYTTGAWGDETHRNHPSPWRVPASAQPTCRSQRWPHPVRVYDGARKGLAVAASKRRRSMQGCNPPLPHLSNHTSSPIDIYLVARGRPDRRRHPKASKCGCSSQRRVGHQGAPRRRPRPQPPRREGPSWTSSCCRCCCSVVNAIECYVGQILLLHQCNMQQTSRGRTPSMLAANKREDPAQ